MRDALAQLHDLGTEAVGISPDSVAGQKKFSDKLALNFPLLSDADHTVAEAYGVKKGLLGITRSAFLVDESGKILEAWPKISPEDTVPKVLAALRAK